jgi:ATP-dependent DNA ligase
MRDNRSQGEQVQLVGDPPDLVAQLRFVEWTAGGRLRHARFLSLRSDKNAREIERK